jgi:hypothetical protein
MATHPTTNPTHPNQTATFSVPEYLSQFPEKALLHPTTRIELTRHRPLLFALLYFPRHITQNTPTGPIISINEFQLALIHKAEQWAIPPNLPRARRYADIAPRESGKTTWDFLILPMWAAAHRHKRFAAAFADSGTQAEIHLATFRTELDENALLRNDFPQLTNPARRKSGNTKADRSDLYIAENGFVFAAKGIEAGSLGLKVEEQRPDLLILDDIEPPEEKYSPYQAKQRLRTMVEAVFPMNIYADVLITGTVTMRGSIIDQLVRYNAGERDPDSTWIEEENIQVNHFLPILDPHTPNERSLWPEKWPLQYLHQIQHTASYRKNMANDSSGIQGDFWQRGDIHYVPATATPRPQRYILQIDPAVTTKTTSDETGIAVLSIDPTLQTKPTVLIHYADGTRKLGQSLTEHLNRIIYQFPDITLARIEINQGGDLHKLALQNLDIPLRTLTNSAPKHIRFNWALNHYQATPPRVLHTRPLPRLESQLTSYPRTPHDDIADAAVSGILYFLGSPRKRTARVRTTFPT